MAWSAHLSMAAPGAVASHLHAKVAWVEHRAKDPQSAELHAAASHAAWPSAGAEVGEVVGLSGGRGG